MSRIPTLILALCCAASTLSAGVDYDAELTGQNLQMGTLLTWSTLEETDNRHFLVERSADGLSFESIGTVAGAGSSDERQAYSFLDVMAASATGYYRLRQVDHDDTQTLSHVISVPQAFPNDFLITSMSAASTDGPFALSVDVLTPGRLDYRLFDFGGDLLEGHTLEARSGLHDLAFDLSAHPEGIYRVQLQMGQEQETLYVRRILEGFGAKPNVAAKESDRNGRQ